MNIANNTLIKQPQTAVTPKTGEFTYLANGEEVKLSFSLVKKYLVSGDADRVTDQEVLLFMSICRYQHLNPFLREVHLVKYGNEPATIVTGKETFTKRAEKNPLYMGKEAGVIVINAAGEIEQREGAFCLKDETLVGGWAKIYIKDKAPEYAAVSIDEYIGLKKDGTPNRQWATRPATMIRKVALVHALREAFPNDLGALLSPEEIGRDNPNIDVDEIVTNSSQVVIEEQTQAKISQNPAMNQTAPQPQAQPQAQAGKDTNVPTTSQAQPESVQSVLFG